MHTYNQRDSRLEWLIAMLISLDNGTEVAVDWLMDRWYWNREEVQPPKKSPAQAWIDSRR